MVCIEYFYCFSITVNSPWTALYFTGIFKRILPYLKLKALSKFSKFDFFFVYFCSFPQEAHFPKQIRLKLSQYEMLFTESRVYETLSNHVS